MVIKIMVGRDNNLSNSTLYDDHDEGGGRGASGLEDRDERDQEDPGGSQAAC